MDRLGVRLRKTMRDERLGDGYGDRCPALPQRVRCRSLGPLYTIGTESLPPLKEAEPKGQSSESFIEGYDQPSFLLGKTKDAPVIRAGHDLFHCNDIVSSFVEGFDYRPRQTDCG